MIKKIITGAALVAVLAGAAAFAFQVRADESQQAQAKTVGSTLEIHVTDNGKVLVRGAKVTGISGNNISAITTWGSVSFNWTVETDSNTDIIRRFGAKSSLSEISNGDFISFTGILDTSSSAYAVRANVVKDWSIQKAYSAFSGTVSNVNADAQNFTFATANRGNLTVNVSASTDIRKGNTTTTFSSITDGMQLTVEGVWDTISNTLAASKIRIPAPVVPKVVVQGTVTQTNPLVISVNETSYTVNISSDTAVLNSRWLRTDIANFQVGNTVRVYGAVNAASGGASGTIDATVVRDVSLR